MNIEIISIFPEIFGPVFDFGMLRLARERGLLEINLHDLRDFTTDKHRQVDDVPYGGGPGMVMKPEPFFAALKKILGHEPYLVPGKTRTILLSPRGDRLTQRMVHSLAAADRMVVLCGRYEGVDARVGAMVTDEISIGDYVLSGGEFGAMVLVDAVARLISGVLGDEASLDEESFSNNLLEYPQFTRPSAWRGFEVPDVLRSGDHGAIRAWRRRQAELITKVRRPDITGKRYLGRASNL